MLFDGSMTTPRPKPPAKARRSASAVQLKQDAITPPPPYMSRDSSLSTFSFPSFDGNMRPPINSLLGSPIPKTAQLVGWDPRERLSLKKEDMDRLNGQSREELTDLMSRANELIKERESELGATSAVARTLHESNVSLKGKHEALLARIPSVNSPLNSPVSSVSPISPFLLGSSLPRSIKESMGHFRRISVSPADIALLSDQNSELMHQLEKLEDESTKADQAGRRVLRKLEKEITELRAELDRTQARSAELEQKASMEDSERRKREREAKLRAIRGKPANEEGEQEEGDKEVRDFAPAHPLSSSQRSPNLLVKQARRVQGSPTFSPPLPSTPPPDVNLLTKPTSTRSSHEKSSSLSSVGSYDAPVPFPEYALMSQLLTKIQELEGANAAIRAQQADTASKLQTVQKDAATISKVYECLAGDGDVDVEWEVGSECEQDQSKGVGGTVRFKSLRRKLEGGTSPVVGEDDDVFGGAKNYQDTARALNVHTQKTRKSVVGLFDTPRDHQPHQIHHERSHSLGPASPALSSLSIMSSNHPLRSSLARELGSSWDEEPNSGIGSGQTYQRMSLSSLYDVDPLPVPSSPPGSRTTSMLLAPAKPEPLTQRREDGDLHGGEPLTGLWTPVSINDGPVVSVDRNGDNLRFKKMSQTVRARTRRWVDGRFKNTLLGSSEQATDGVQFPRQPDLQKRIAKGLDVMMDSFSGVPSSSLRSERQRSQSLHSFSYDKHGQQFQPSQLLTRSPPQSSSKGPGSIGSQTQPRVQHQQQKRRESERGFMRVVLELWLWLQFGIIILVFLWAIARRGPKTVLDEAEKRRSRVISTTGR